MLLCCIIVIYCCCLLLFIIVLQKQAHPVAGQVSPSLTDPHINRQRIPSTNGSLSPSASSPTPDPRLAPNAAANSHPIPFMASLAATSGKSSYSLHTNGFSSYNFAAGTNSTTPPHLPHPSLNTHSTAATLPHLSNSFSPSFSSSLPPSPAVSSYYHHHPHHDFTSPSLPPAALQPVPFLGMGMK